MTALAEYSIPVGISACLLGQRVRFDGGHKRSQYCMNVLAECFDFKPYCPEVAIGMSTPREPIRLVRDGDTTRVRGVKDSSLDVTEKLRDYAVSVANEQRGLCGYVFMKNSPSCGMERVKVYDGNSVPQASGIGEYARQVMLQHPALPVEEEGRLNDPLLRENFITRVFAFYHWRHDVLTAPSLHAVLQFHSRYKYQLMAHSYHGYKTLGRYLAQTAPHEPLEDVLRDYIVALMAALKKRATRKNHCNVLSHVMGYVKNEVDNETKHDLLDAIEQYRSNEVHLVVPITLLKHYLKRHGNDYIKSQAYLDPYPHALGLRNYI